MADTVFITEIHNFEGVREEIEDRCARCNAIQEHRNHPHEFRKSAAFATCVCTLSPRALIHQMSRV